MSSECCEKAPDGAAASERRPRKLPGAMQLHSVLHVHVQWGTVFICGRCERKASRAGSVRSASEIPAVPVECIHEKKSAVVLDDCLLAS